MRSIAFGLGVLNIVCIVFAVMKGKHVSAFFGVFVPLVSLFAAIRLARPESRWARRYSPAQLAKATERTKRFDARFEPISRWVTPFVTGTARQPDRHSADP